MLMDTGYDTVDQVQTPSDDVETGAAESGRSWRPRDVIDSARAKWLPTAGRWPLRLTVAALVVFPFVYGIVALHRGEEADFDLLNYHFFDPFWVLADHQRDVMAAQLQTYYNPTLDIPFYYAARHLSPRVVSYGVAVVQGLSFPILYLIARVFTRRRVLALAAAGLGMFGAGALLEIGTVMGDTLTAPLMLGGLLLGLRVCVRSGEAASRRGIAMAAAAGGLSGLGAGLKLSAFPFCVATVAAFVVVGLPFARRLALAAAAAGGVVAGLLVSYGWWGYELAVRWGSPLLPYLNGLFASPYAPLGENLDQRRLPNGPLEALLYPFIWTLHWERVGPFPFRELALPILEAVLFLLLAKGVAVCLCRRAWRPIFGSDAERYIVLFAIVTYVIWVFVFGIYRYLIPLEMLSFVLLGVCTRRLLAPARSWPAAAVLLSVIVAVSLVTEWSPPRGRTPWASRYFAVTVPPALASPAAFLIAGENANAYVIPYFPTSDFFAGISGNIPPTPRAAALIERDLRGYSHVYLLWSSPPAPFRSYERFFAQANPPWQRYGFVVDERECVALPVRVGTVRERMHACPLGRT